MGLDCNFYLRNKNNKEIDIFFCTFRKYYELDEYIRTMELTKWSEDLLTNKEKDFYKRNEMTPPTADQVEMWILHLDDINKIINLIEPLYNDLMKLSGAISYYDDHGYPSKIIKTHYDNSLNPATSDSAFAGVKLQLLYCNLIAMREVLENNQDYHYNPEEDKYITDDNGWYFVYDSNY